MAGTNISVAPDPFSCSVCLDLFNDPVTLLCGHSFCMVCINNCWDQEDQQGVYSCPQCRETFSPRPAVCKNTVLAEVVESLRRENQEKRPAHSSTVNEDIECDFCTENKSKAIKSCLVCLASFCETHLQPHYKSPAFKKHKLVEASSRLQEQICSQHDKLLEVYCRTDQRCICMLCTMDEHKGHDTVSVTAGRAEKQEQFVNTQRKYREGILAKTKKHQELTEAVEFYERCAERTVQEIKRIFTDLIKSIEKGYSEVTALVRAQEKAAVSRAEEHMTRLEKEIEELNRRNAELEELSHTHPIQFLQSFPSLSDEAKSPDLHDVSIRSQCSFTDVTALVSGLRDKVKIFCSEEVRVISTAVREFQIIPLPEPQSREEFQQYSCYFTLDPDTANTHLCLSSGNRVVSCSQTAQSYSVHPDRFDHYLQVLCRERVLGPCYWEVDWTGPHGVSVAVSYKSISRKGKGTECLFGRNDHSWRLFCYPSCYSFRHDKKEIEIPLVPGSSKVGVFVDYKAGTLSFYSVSDTMNRLLHRVHATFTQPLYPGFAVCIGSTIKL